MVNSIQVQNAAEQFLTKNHRYSESLDLVQRNVSGGNVWLIGSFLYQGICSVLYGAEYPESDLDFIIDSPKSEIALPVGWNLTSNRFGQRKFVRKNPEIKIDFIHLDEISYFQQRNIRPDIENFLPSSPLDIQCLAYDTKYRLLIGGIGIEAIRSRRIKPMSRESVEFAARKKEVSVTDYIRKKEEKLCF